MESERDFFLKPSKTSHRQYEVMRAVIVDKVPVHQAAQRFGYATGSVRNLLKRLREQPESFKLFSDVKRGPKPRPEEPLRVRRTQRILTLRKQQKLSVTEIQQQLLREGIQVGTTTIAQTIRRAGLPKLPRRTAKQLAAAGAERVPAADRSRLDLTPRRFQTRFGGLFLFAFDLVRMNLDDLLNQCRFPGGSRIPRQSAPCARCLA